MHRGRWTGLRTLAAAGLCALSLGTVSACTGRSQTPEVYDDPYDPQAAVAYSYDYALVRNPAYPNFDSNCTNYISQCLVAGGKQMDQALAPQKDVRITYHAEEEAWFCASMHTDQKRWKEFSVSTSFCRTESFVEYWTQVRGMSYTTYVNSVDGLLKLYEVAEPGDVITLYGADGALSHLCLVSAKGDMRLLINANTKDYQDRNLLEISSLTYPNIGLIEME